MRLFIVKLLLIFLFSPLSWAGDNIFTANIEYKEKLLFTESLAMFVSGTILEQGEGTVDGKIINSSVIRIPGYYGYHSFLLVLDNFIAYNTSLTAMRTWRMDEKNFYVIDISGKNMAVRIVYDTHASVIMLSLPAGY
ncbi:MAG: hypothetical protein ACFCUM_14305 [Bacteroidales bacterium]